MALAIPFRVEAREQQPDQIRPGKRVEWHTHQQNQTSSSCADSRNVFFVTWMGEWWSAVSVSYMKFCLLFVLHFRCTMIRAIEIKIKIEKMVSQVRDGFNESVSEWVGPMLVSWSSSSSSVSQFSHKCLCNNDKLHICFWRTYRERESGNVSLIRQCGMEEKRCISELEWNGMEYIKQIGNNNCDKISDYLMQFRLTAVVGN